MKIHIVQKGETIWDIAEEHGVDYEDVIEHNPQISSPDMIMPGMKIKIPVSSKQVKQKTPGKEKEMKQDMKETKKKPPTKEQPKKKNKKDMKESKQKEKDFVKKSPSPIIDMPKMPVLPEGKKLSKTEPKEEKPSTPQDKKDYVKHEHSPKKEKKKYKSPKKDQPMHPSPAPEMQLPLGMPMQPNMGYKSYCSQPYGTGMMPVMPYCCCQCQMKCQPCQQPYTSQPMMPGQWREGGHPGSYLPNSHQGLPNQSLGMSHAYRTREQPTSFEQMGSSDGWSPHMRINQSQQQPAVETAEKNNPQFTSPVDSFPHGKENQPSAPVPPMYPHDINHQYHEE